MPHPLEASGTAAVTDMALAIIRWLALSELSTEQLKAEIRRRELADARQGLIEAKVPEEFWR
jgi:hypothetical protein